jgi:hypothetical protein
MRYPLVAQLRGKGFRVLHDLGLIFLEAKLKSFVEAHRFRCDHMHERAALNSGKYE